VTRRWSGGPLRLASCAFLICGAASQARAQTGPGLGTAPFTMPAAEPHLFKALKKDAMTLTPDVQLLDVGVDTNVFDVTGTERRKPDFTATVRPEAVFQVRTRGFELQARAWAGLVYYQRYADQRSVDPGNLVAFERRFSSLWQVYGTGSLAYTRERTGFEIDARARHLQGSVMAGTRFRSHKLAFDLQGGRSVNQWDAAARYQGVALADALNRTATFARLLATYRLSPYTSATASAVVSADRFDTSPIRNTDTVRGALGAIFDPRAVVHGDAEIGYARATPRNPITPPFAGPVGSAGLEYRFHDTTSLGAGVRRDLEFSFSPTQPYYIYDLIEGSIRQALLHRLDAGVTAGWTRLEYRSFAGVPAAVPGTQDDAVLRHVDASVGLVVTKRFRVSVYAARWQRVSGTSPYISDRFGLQMAVGRANVNARGVFLNGPPR
jgi:hypothetical protein